MAKVHVPGIFVLILMGALLLEQSYLTDAYEIVFSPELTTDFAKGSIDVPSLIRQDWLQLPVVGFCGLASKFSKEHKIDTSGIKGNFYTTFEYLTHDCTAEHKRDNNTCAILTAAFTVCLGFPLDRRTCNHPWGYCSNFNFRLSYLWVPNATNITLAGPEPRSRLASIADPPAASDLASVQQDVRSLGKLDPFGSQASGGRLDTGCDWRYSNLVPVAWDGIQNVLPVGQNLQSHDASYSLVMQQDCNLVLYKRGDDGKLEFNAKWASFSHFSDPFFHNCTTVLQPNGNLEVLDPWGLPRWASNGTSQSLYTSVLAVLRNGTIAVYEMNSGTVLWSSG